LSTLPAQLESTSSVSSLAPARFSRAHRLNPVDRATAERTIPRGSNRSDSDPTPAVDAAIWLDHVVYARTGDPRVLDRLVREYEGYARSLARRLHRDHDSHEDLDQVALEALVVAIRRFDPERAIPFPAFATPTILGALRRHYRDHGWTLRVPRRVHEFAMQERVVADQLALRLGRTPTGQELAEAMGLSVDALLEAQDAIHARRTLSLDADASTGPGSPQLPQADSGFREAEDRLVAAEAIATLDDPARELLRLYFMEELSQSEIAARLNVSQMQVSRLLAAVLRRLRVRVSDPATA